jgi:hypothetical protein
VRSLDAIENRLIGRVLEVVDNVHESGALTQDGKAAIRGRVVSAVHQACDDIEGLAQAGELLRKQPVPKGRGFVPGSA